MMLEELQRRNFSRHTIRYYIRTVEDFARRFNCRPDRLGPRHIREYQAELFQKRKLSPGTVTNRLAALRFFYIKTLKKAWSIAETPYPQKQRRLPTILSQEEVARLIDAASTTFHRTLLMTLYATGLRCAELTNLKTNDVDSQRMVIRVRGGKWGKDRDVMLSSKLLEELRKHWRRLRVRRKPSDWLFPGNRWHTADHPHRHQNASLCLSASRQACGSEKSGPSPHAAPLLRHSSTRSRYRPPHHSDPVRPSRSEGNHRLPASLRTSPESNGESPGLAATEKRVTAGRVDESAAPRGGRSHPRCGSCFHRTKSPVDSLEACQSAAGHRALSYRRTRWSSRRVHPLRVSCHHLLQLLPQPALPEVSDLGSRTVDRCASPRTSSNTLRPCSLYASCAAGTPGVTEQEVHLWPAASRQCGNTSRSHSRSKTPWRGNRFLQCAAYLESEAQTASPCPLRHSRWWVESRSHSLGEITKPVLSSPQGAVESFSRQVRR